MTDPSILERLPFWPALSESEQKYVSAAASTRRYDKGQLIHAVDASCLGMTMVLGGEARLSVVSEEGREVTLFWLGVGECCMLSASCVIDAVTLDVSMTATSDCELLTVRASAIEQLAETNLAVRSFMYEALCRHLSAALWAMQAILFKGYDRRLAAFLVAEYDRTGSPEVKMTHEQIAERTNTAREVVARMLKRFAADGLLTVRRGLITLDDVESLRRMQ